MELSIGKQRRLQQCSTPDGLFTVMAIDPLDELRRALNPGNPESIAFGEMAAFKTDVVRALGPVSSAVAVDPEYGAAPVVIAGALPGRTGLIVTVEATPDPDAHLSRRGRLLPKWSPAQAARLGAAGFLLALDYHPEARTAPDVESLVTDIAEQCRLYDMPLFVESRVTLDHKGVPLAPVDHRAVIVEAARRLAAAGADLLVTALPVNPTEKDEGVWAAACGELTEASPVPWLLAGAATGFDALTRRTEVACRAGACGVLAGWSIWREAVQLRNHAQSEFLYRTAVDRLVELSDIVAEYGAPWTQHFTTPPGAIDENWHSDY